MIHLADFVIVRDKNGQGHTGVDVFATHDAHGQVMQRFGVQVWRIDRDFDRNIVGVVVVHTVRLAGEDFDSALGCRDKRHRNNAKHEHPERRGAERHADRRRCANGPFVFGVAQEHLADDGEVIVGRQH